MRFHLWATCLADTQMGIHIAWITDTPLELPLTGFGPNQDDLLNAVQNWIGGIGSPGPDTAVPFPYGYITKTCDRPKADANKSFNLRY